MKYIDHIGFMLAAFGIFAGCTVMETDILDPDPGTTRVALAVNTVGVATKGIYTGIGQQPNYLQRIGVLVVRADGTTPYEATAPLQVFHCDVNGAWGIKQDTLYLTDNPGTVYAYSVKRNADDTNNTLGAKLVGGEPLMYGPILADQTCTPPAAAGEAPAVLNQEDYLYGVTPGSGSHPVVNRASNKVSLDMRHFLSKVSFKFMKDDGQPVPDDKDYIKKVTLTATDAPLFMAGTGDFTMNMKDGTITGTPRIAVLTFVPNDSKQVDTNAAEFTNLLPKMFGLVAPVSNVKGTITVMLGAAGNTTYDRTYLSATTTFTWTKGNHYIYTIKMQDAGLQVGKPQVAGWNETTSSQPIQPDGVTPN